MKVSVRTRESGGVTVLMADIRVVPAGEELSDRFRLVAPANLTTEAAVEKWGWEQARLIATKGRPVCTKKGKAAVLAKVEAVEAAKAPTLQDYWPVFLERCRGHRQKPSTIETKESLARTYMLPALGSLDLRECCSQDAQDKLRSALRVVGHSRANSGLLLLKAVLRSAAERYQLKLPKVGLVKADKIEKLRCYTPEEYDAMVTAARDLGPRFLLPVLLGGDCGLRVGEIIALAWKVIDLDRGSLQVLASAWEGEVGSPKSGRSRKIPLTSRLITALRQVDQVDDLVVVRVRGGGGIANHASMESVIRAVVKRAGVPNRGSHGLRHSYATRMINAGVPVQVVQRLLGHVDLKTTSAYLAHLPGAESLAVAALERGDRRKDT